MKDKKELISLLNGCSCTQIAISPQNWNEPRASLNKKWFLWYRFHDPRYKEQHPTGKLVIIKGDLNSLPALMSRRQLAKAMIDKERNLLEKLNYNPITGKYMVQEVKDVPKLIPKDTPLLEALTWAIEKKKCDEDTRIDLKSVLRYFSKGLKTLGFDSLPLNTVNRGHIYLALEEMAEIKKDKWTDNNYNHYRAYIGMMFVELITRFIMEDNPVEKIPVKDVTRKKRKKLTDAERIKIYNELRRVNFRFWVLINIFCLAGCRRKELVKVQRCNVDLENQRFKAISYKGRRGSKERVIREMEYTICDSALPFWKIACMEADPEDYLFSEDLLPQKYSINARQITRRWKLWVKERFDIEADFYSLKHMITTMISAKYGTAIAAAFNNESEEMIKEIYDVDYQERQHALKRSININFLPEVKSDGTFKIA